MKFNLYINTVSLYSNRPDFLNLQSTIDIYILGSVVSVLIESTRLVLGTQLNT